jgi:ADP-heptose:LPS heptosyltransferase
MFNASQTFGYYKPGNYCPDPQHFFPYPENQHEVLKWLQLLDRIGIPSQGSELEFPVSESDTKEFEALATHSSLAHLRYICIHPGARDIKRRWSAKEFAIVADALASYGYSIILTGTHEEREVTTAVISQMKSAVCDLTGKTTLGILAAVVQNATLVIANDTGISHLASALKTPSVIIIPTSHLSTWAPLDTQLHMSLPLESATAKIVISKAKAMLASRNQHTEESSRSRELVL